MSQVIISVLKNLTVSLTVSYLITSFLKWSWGWMMYLNYNQSDVRSGTLLFVILSMFVYYVTSSVQTEYNNSKEIKHIQAKSMDSKGDK